MEDLRMKLPFLKKYRYLKPKHDGYKIFNQDGTEVGSFVLQHEHQTYYAEVTLYTNVDKNMYVKHKGTVTADGYSLEHLLFLNIKPSYRELIFQLKELVY
jgi:hypothetical protein